MRKGSQASKRKPESTVSFPVAEAAPQTVVSWKGVLIVVAIVWGLITVTLLCLVEAEDRMGIIVLMCSLPLVAGIVGGLVVGLYRFWGLFLAPVEKTRYWKSLQNVDLEAMMKQVLTRRILGLFTVEKLLCVLGIFGIVCLGAPFFSDDHNRRVFREIVTDGSIWFTNHPIYGTLIVLGLVICACDAWKARSMEQSPKRGCQRQQTNQNPPEMMSNRNQKTSKTQSPAPALISIRRNGTTLGPYTMDQVQQMLADGIIYPVDSACRDGDSTWEPLYSLGFSTGERHNISPKTKGRLSKAIAGFVVIVAAFLAIVGFFSFLFSSNDKPGKSIDSALNLPKAITGTWQFESRLNLFNKPMIDRDIWTFSADGTATNIHRNILDHEVEDTQKKGSYVISGSRVIAHFDGTAKTFECDSRGEFASLGDDGRRFVLQKVDPEASKRRMSAELETEKRLSVTFQKAAEMGRLDGGRWALDHLTPPTTDYLEEHERAALEAASAEISDLDRDVFLKEYEKEFAAMFRYAEQKRAPAF